MPKLTLTFTDHADSFIESGIASGRFADANEAVAEGIGLLEEREEDEQARKEWLEAAIQESREDIERGDYVTLESPEQIDEFFRQTRQEVSAQLAHD